MALLFSLVSGFSQTKAVVPLVGTHLRKIIFTGHENTADTFQKTYFLLHQYLLSFESWRLIFYYFNSLKQKNCKAHQTKNVA